MMMLKNILSILFLLILSFCFAVVAHAGLTKISDGVYGYVDIKGASPAKGFGANTGVIVGRDGILVVDTLCSAKQAAVLIKDIRAISDKPVKYVVNTHAHIDHAYGNSEFRKLGTLIISHVNSKKSMDETGEATIRGAAEYGLSADEMEGTTLAVPDISFDRSMEIDLGGRKVRLIHLGPAHTDGDTLVYLPAEKILFAGDVLFTNYHPYLAEGKMDGWIKTLDEIKAMEVDAIIPGHGPVSGKKDLDDMKDYLLVFDKKAKELCASSQDIDYVSTEMKRSLPKRDELDLLIKANVSFKYLKNR